MQTELVHALESVADGVRAAVLALAVAIGKTIDGGGV